MNVNTNNFSPTVSTLFAVAALVIFLLVAFGVHFLGLDLTQEVALGLASLTLSFLLP